MCGFAGFFGGNIENRREVAEKMGERIAHRGPDDKGFLTMGTRRSAFAGCLS